MSIKIGKFFSRMGVLLAVVAVVGLAPAELHSSAVKVESKGTYSLQVNDAVAAADLVLAVGGQVESSVTMINVLEVELSDEQLRLISVSPLVVRISEGPASSVFTEAQVAGRYWLL